jgi:thioredoxin-dependent peroxiredoxin
MKMLPGTPAPFFQAETLNGRIISLQDYKNKNLLIKFYRFATCPVCNLHLRHFVNQFADLQKEGLSVVGIFHSPKWRMEKTMKYDLPFELLSDPDKKIFRSYGVESSWAGMFSWPVMRDYARALKAGLPAGMLSHDGGIKGHPADFIVNKEGKIIYAHYGRNYADSLSVKQVVDVVKQIRINAAVDSRSGLTVPKLETA